MLIRSLGIAAALALALMETSPAREDSFPKERITVVVPYSPGNGLDLLGREFATAINRQLGVPTVVDNRTGAAGVIGTIHAAAAEPDGYTLLFTAHPPFAISPLAMDRPAYDPISTLQPVARVGSVPLVLVTSSKWPIRTFEELTTHARSYPEKANYASSGIGSPGQLYGELLNRATGLTLQEIAYKSTGQGLTDVMAGEVLASLVSVPAAAPHIKSGRLVPLAVGSKSRLPEFHDVPTLAEVLKQPDFQAGVWYGFFAPAGVPKERVQTLFSEIARAARSEGILSFMSQSSMVPELQDPIAFKASLLEDVKTARQLLETARLLKR